MYRNFPPPLDAYVRAYFELPTTAIIAIGFMITIAAMVLSWWLPRIK